jgi:threonine dehydrogenase-like Zn-dependent dehydrogenase
MRELIFVHPGHLEWREAPDPQIQHVEDAIVRPVASTTCDLDGLIIRGRRPEMFPGPFAIGHECIAEIVELGSGVTGLHAGQLAVVNWHISCGRCDRCRGGHPNACRNHPDYACYGLPWRVSWGGTFSDLLRVPFASFALTPLPPGLDPVKVASAADNIPFGYELTVPYLEKTPGAPMLILGGVGSIALYAVMFAVAAGASQTDYVDNDPRRLTIAESLGASIIEGPAPSRMKSRYPIVVDASGSVEGLQCAVRSVDAEGTVCSCGGHLDNAVPFPVHEMYVRGTHFYTGRGRGGPNVAKALDWVTAGRVRPELVTSEVVDFDDAPRALAEPSLKPVLYRPPIGGSAPMKYQRP